MIIRHEPSDFKATWEVNLDCIITTDWTIMTVLSGTARIIIRTFHGKYLHHYLLQHNYVPPRN